MSNVEVLRREVADANVFALLGATDTARLVIAQAVWASRSDSASTAVWSLPNIGARREELEVRQ